MDFDFSQDQRLLQSTARDFFKRDCPLPRVRELMANPTACDDKLWSGLAEQGWTGMMLPEEVGGLGLDFVDLCVVAEEMGRASLPGPFFSTFWASTLLQQAANSAKSETSLEQIAQGELKATVAWLDPDGSWCPHSITLSAQKSGGNYTLSGRKRLVTDAESADLIVAVARIGDAWGILPFARDAKGVSVRATPAMDETRKLADVTLDKVTVPADDVLIVKDAAVLERVNDFASIFLCAELVGAMQWFLDTSVDFAKARHQFDKPIGVFQGVQHQCATMLLYTESARSAAYYAAWCLSADDPAAAQAAAVAKAYCSEAGRIVGNHACQIHGGIGFTWEHDLHLFYKRAKFSEALLGDATYHRERIARRVLDQTPATV